MYTFFGWLRMGISCHDRNNLNQNMMANCQTNNQINIELCFIQQLDLATKSDCSPESVVIFLSYYFIIIGSQFYGPSHRKHIEGAPKWPPLNTDIFKCMLGYEN